MPLLGALLIFAGQRQASGRLLPALIEDQLVGVQPIVEL